MKYESSILKRLIDTYGVIGNPRYLSEIIKGFIVRGKELYPQLFTYQSDWLAHIDEFGLTPEYTVSYTGQHIYAPNTKEKPVKRAILKGSTEINIKGTLYDDNEIKKDYNIPLVKNNTNYLIKYEIDYTPLDGITEPIFAIGFLSSSTTWWSSNLESQPSKNTVILNSGSEPGYFRIIGRREDISTINNVNLLIIEYQQGMENWDIPYFEGMQSVKMPVLTTSNEDGTKTNILTVNEPIELRGIGDVKDELNCLTGEMTERIGEIVLNGSENWWFANSPDNPEITGTWTHSENTWLLGVDFTTISSNTRPVKNTISDKYPVYYICDFSDSEYFNILSDNNALLFRVRKDRFSDKSIVNFKSWLSQNPITVQYQLTTESVKTVDLTIHDKDHQKVERLTSFEGGTHFTPSSQDGSLLPTLTVDVVTDLEETLMVCSLEGNTM